MRKLNLKEAVELTVNAINSGVPVLCHGDPGTGKSKGWAKQVAETIGAELYIFLPSHHDFVAINGLPVPNLEKGTTDVMVNGFFAKFFQPPYATGEKKALIVLDEFGQANELQQAPLFELVQNKIVAGKKLPDSVHIIAITNKLKGGALVKPMATPLRNRFIHFELIADRKGWVYNWLNKQSHLSNEVKTFAEGFVEARPELFYGFDKAAKNPEIYAYPTARSWEFFLKLLQEKSGGKLENVDADTVAMLGEVALGDEAGANLYAFFKLREVFPDIKAIEEGKKVNISEEQLEDPAFVYAFASSLSSRCLELTQNGLSDEDDKKRVENILTFAENTFRKDVSMWVAISLTRKLMHHDENWALEALEVLAKLDIIEQAMMLDDMTG